MKVYAGEGNPRKPWANLGYKPTDNCDCASASIHDKTQCDKCSVRHKYTCGNVPEFVENQRDASTWYPIHCFRCNEEEERKTKK